MPTDSERNIPREIGGYQIIDILGEGGMSVVYTAMQRHPRRKVAIKVLRGGIFSPTAARRFHLEVEILGKLDHPWIAKVYDAGTHDDGNGATPYFVMEHIEDARELTPYLEDEKLERREVLKLFAKISSAIEHGHHRGVVHRDLKPGNILIDKNGEPKIIDFGVARSLDNNTVGEEAMTEAGRLVGTVQFMAPEQVDPKVKDIDTRCDVYALGVVLYQMLTSRFPRTLEGLPIYEAVRQICEEDPVRPTVHDKTIDPNLEAIIMKAIQNERDKRYATAGSMGRDMLRYLGHRPIKARKVSVTDRTKLFIRRHKKQLLVSSLICIGLALVTSAFLFIQNVEENEIERLEAENTELRAQKETTPTEQEVIQEVAQGVPIFSLPENAQKITLSPNGNAVSAIVDKEFFVWRTDGTQVRVPPMNIDPEFATLALSRYGKSLGVVSDSKCRIAKLGFNPEDRAYVSARFSRPLAAVVTTAVDTNRIAISGDNMTLEILEEDKKTKRAASMSGPYLCVELPSPDLVVAATPRTIVLWSNNSFPNNAIQLDGVENPIAVGMVHQKPVVVGRDRDVVLYTRDQVKRFTLDLPDVINFASLDSSGLHLACVVGTSVYRCDLKMRVVQEVASFTEELGGVAISDEETVVCWTISGEVYVLD